MMVRVIAYFKSTLTADVIGKAISAFSEDFLDSQTFGGEVSLAAQSV